MWGNILTETAFPVNYSFAFPSTHSDVLLHLTHWQYWFWFWFTYFLVLYYLIFLRLVRFRVFKMSPKIATSFLSHGKWGDLIVCFVPISWCTNILSNSNFILRMIEWQSESSLFTVRVRGKQWYWVYKFELKVFKDILNVPKNMGHNFWVKTSECNNHYLGLIQARHDLEPTFLGWEEGLSNPMWSAQASLAGEFQQGLSSCSLKEGCVEKFAPNTYPIVAEGFRGSDVNYISKNFFLNNCVVLGEYVPGNSEVLPALQLSMKGCGVNIADDITRTAKTSIIGAPALRLHPHSSEIVMLRWRSQQSFSPKPATGSFYLVLKQKRFNPVKLKSQMVLRSGDMQSSSAALDTYTYFQQKSLVRRTSEAKVSLQSHRRLLRTRRVLVLPAHTNITVITNSFDVMHSWYIPGLGVKLDCVPGRSTHHTLHIDHAGFYYGQCAEICGRYHHHMPIRVCALPFEHFLLWWYNYGAPFFLAGGVDRKPFVNVGFRSISW